MLVFKVSEEGRLSAIWFVVLVALLHAMPLAAQSQEKPAEAYGFQDIHLGMSIVEFKTKHPAPKIEKLGPSASPLLGAPRFVRRYPSRPPDRMTTARLSKIGLLQRLNPRADWVERYDTGAHFRSFQRC